MSIRTQVFKDSWAHKGQNAPEYLSNSAVADCRAVENVGFLHSQFWRMVGEEMKAGYVMGFIGQ